MFYMQFYKIIWIVHVLWLVYKCVFMALWNTKMTWAIIYGSLCLQVVRITIDNFMNEFKVYIHALYIVFLFVKTENNFIKEIKHVFCAFIACWKPWQSLWEFSIFRFSLICSRILPNVYLGFHQAMKARRTCFIS